MKKMDAVNPAFLMMKAVSVRDVCQERRSMLHGMVKATTDICGFTVADNDGIF
ncbi:MAG: hypothetical protein ACNA7V_05615 [Bacteroidales bacterium]